MKEKINYHLKSIDYDDFIHTTLIKSVCFCVNLVICLHYHQCKEISLYNEGLSCIAANTFAVRPAGVLRPFSQLLIVSTPVPSAFANSCYVTLKSVPISFISASSWRVTRAGDIVVTP